MAYIFEMKHAVDNRSSALTATRVSYIVPKCHELCSTFHKRLQTGPPFLPLWAAIMYRVRQKQDCF